METGNTVRVETVLDLEGKIYQKIYIGDSGILEKNIPLVICHHHKWEKLYIYGKGEVIGLDK